MNVLFVCTGNTCRSAMAEPMMKKRLAEAGLANKVEVRSAGVAAHGGSAASSGARAALRARGLNGEAHQATRLDGKLVQWADLILTMSQSHKRAILERHIDAMEKTFTLKEFVDDDPRNLEILDRMAQLQAEAQTKQALFMAEHAEELEKLQERYRSGGDRTVERELMALQQRLEESVREEAKEMQALMGKLPSYDVEDPYGGSHQVYEETAREIEGLLDKLVERLREQVE
jgi:protein-tyrosine-phosphatase